jgi:hypothetical protein
MGLVFSTLLLVGAGAPLRAEDGAVTPAPEATNPPAEMMAPETIEAPWQDVISSQIQAFRDHDAPAAFSYAGAGFQTSFPNAETFFNAIVTSGYAPIMDSVSHSFGAFQMVGQIGVIQEVKLVGRDQAIYEAIYQLTEEPVGWRVQGVQLVKQQGIAI